MAVDFILVGERHGCVAHLHAHAQHMGEVHVVDLFHVVGRLLQVGRRGIVCEGEHRLDVDALVTVLHASADILVGVFLVDVDTRFHCAERREAFGDLLGGEVGVAGAGHFVGFAV